MGEKLAWAAERSTKREEDSAYSLLGIFGVFMPPIYGERKEHAMKRLRQTIREAEDKAKENLLMSLRFDQMTSRRANIKDAHRKTCQWLLCQPEYVRWLDLRQMSSHRGLLWIKGNPGAGKSTIMKFAHEQALEQAYENSKSDIVTSAERTIIIAFFFNARGIAIEKSTTGMYRSLLVQLLEDASYMAEVRRLFPFSAVLPSKSFQWTLGTLQDLFSKVVLSVQKPVKCYIDALDECEEHEIRAMISVLRDLGDRALSHDVAFQVCLASRHYPHISIDRGFSLNLDHQAGHTQDIDEYLKAELNIGSSKIAMQIRHDVQKRASGIFLWVVLVVAILNEAYDGGRIHALRRVLDDIPTDLHELFRDILTRDSKNKSELSYCIEWILFAAEPMSPEQLYYAILSGVEPDADVEWDQDEVSHEDIHRFILNSSKGLAEITVPTELSKDLKVQFIHLSVRDFLLKSEGMDYVQSNMGADFTRDSQSRLARCCTSYITKSIVARVQDNGSSRAWQTGRVQSMFIVKCHQYPFLHYAIQYMQHHAAKAREQISSIQFHKLHCTGHSLHGKCGSTPDQRFRRLGSESDGERQDKDLSTVFLSSYANNSHIYCLASCTTVSQNMARIFFQDWHSVQIDPKNDYLQEYGPWGHIFSLLDAPGHASLARVRCLSTDPDIDSPFPLTWMVESDKDSLFWRKSTTTQHPEKVDFKESFLQYGNMLEVAAVDGSLEKAKLLLECGADANMQGGYYGNALQAAVVMGSEPIVKLLLEHGANVNAQGGAYSNALYAAIEMGHTSIVKFLLDNGANAEMPERQYRTMLQAANSNGRWKMVALLEELVVRS